ncbi:DUF6302 family protein [Streptomyces sp. NBC_00133]|uniref:DUF6302 family protein n=1 Tax=Streptomyces sp. NBC_00133 TaxID=2903624 RepID=UPI0038707077
MNARVAHRRKRELPQLTITLVPAAEAYDYEFVASRLHDHCLLHSSVAVRVFRAPLLAVPVGGCRRGGRIGAGPVTVALAIRDALQGRPGFSDMRVRSALSSGSHHWVVEWGDRASDWPLCSPERVRFYGYSDGFVAEPASRLTPPRHGPAATCCCANLPLHRFALDPRDELVERGRR